MTVNASDTLGTGLPATLNLGCPFIASISDVPDEANPTIVIKGSGFGDGEPSDPSYQNKADSPFLNVVDLNKNWVAGLNSTCKEIIGYWSNTEVIFSPQVAQGALGFLSPCSISRGDKMVVQLWPNPGSQGPLRGTTTVVPLNGGSPSVLNINTDYGPTSGGTFQSSGGTVNVYGSDLASADAVWFGKAAAPPGSTSYSDVTVQPPSVPNAAGVHVQVATPGGRSGDGICPTYQTGCGDDYFFMSSLSTPWSLTGSFPQTPVSESLSAGTPSDAVCQASGGGTVTGQIGGDIESVGGIFYSSNSVGPGNLWSSVIAQGSIDIKKIEASLEFGLTGTVGCDLPIPGLNIPYLGGVDLRVQGQLSGNFTVEVTLTNIDLTVNGIGWVNGHPIADTTLSCNGTDISLSNLSGLKPCVQFKEPNFSDAVSLEVGPEIDLGPKVPGVTANIKIASLVGFGAVRSTANGLQLGTCWAPLDASYQVNFGDVVSNQGSRVIPTGVQLFGSACPFTTYTADPNDMSATAVGGTGTLDVSQYGSNPEGPTNFDSTGEFGGVQAVSDPFTSVTVSDCSQFGGNSLYWWNGTNWQYVADASGPTGSPPCMSFVATDSTTPNLSDLANAVFALGIGPPISIDNNSLPQGNVGDAYASTAFTASNAVYPETWSVTSGALPPGLTLTTGGKLSGIPSSAGTYNFTVSVTDSEATPGTASEAMSITIGEAPSTTTLVASSSTVATGQDETFTATVSSLSTPGGTVNFTGNNSAISTCQGVPLTVSLPHTATCTVSYPEPGGHSVTATYTGDPLSASSNSSGTAITVTGVASQLTITTNSVPDATMGSAYPDTTLGASGGTGPYTWVVTTGSLPPGLSLDPTTGDLSGAPTSGAGSSYFFTVTATDSEVVPETATQALSITVDGATTSTSVSASAATVNTAQTETYTATVSAQLAPGGTVSFADNGSAIASCQDVALSSLVPYTATCTVSYQAAGTHSVSATYSGDSSTLTSTSSEVSVTVVLSGTTSVSVNPTTTTVSVNPTTAATGTSVTYSATVTGFGATPMGAVSFTIGSTHLCTAPLLAGSGSCTASDAPSGIDTVTATYSGDAAFDSSVGTAILTVNTPPSSTPPSTASPGCSSSGVGSASFAGGYWLAAANGAVYSCGDAPFYGSLVSLHVTPSEPIVGIAATPDDKGYWLVASDGGLFAFGDAQFHGSMGGKPLNKPVVGIAATSGGGYYEVASDGGVFSFGPGATFYGSMGGKPLNKPVVGIAVDPTGGYYELASDGGVFSFGPGATFHGSTGCLTLTEPIVAMVVSSDTSDVGAETACGFNSRQAPGGYEFVAGDGGVFSFGNGVFAGSLGAARVTGIVGIANA